jgi:gliding motility-associated lipoprotein GldH
MYNVQIKTSFSSLFTLFIVLLTSYFISSCNTIDIYEKNVSVPGHQWSSSFKPEFNFIIKDSTALYQPYFILRHTEKYNYNNIWINFYYQLPGDSVRKEIREMKLATNEQGWLTKGMNDIYEHRLPVTDKPFKLKTGNYKFSIENIMREDPLLHIINVGIRIEKKQ